VKSPTASVRIQKTTEMNAGSQFGELKIGKSSGNIIGCKALSLDKFAEEEVCFVF
jgi:hypothetical protein